MDSNGGAGSRRTPKSTNVYTSVDRNPAVQGELVSRLKKIEGQVRGVQKMIQDCRDCGEIITQLAAIKSAVNRVSITVLACHLADTIKKDLREGRDVRESLSEFMEVFKKFS